LSLLSTTKILYFAIICKNISKRKDSPVPLDEESCRGEYNNDLGGSLPPIIANLTVMRITL
jgi:hypothetical protein